MGLSEQTEFIEREEGTSSTSSIGAITTATSIQPYQTYWDKDETFMQTAFKDANNGVNYYSLFMPYGTITTYWLASRGVSARSINCYFYVNYVLYGRVQGLDVYHSDDTTVSTGRALFPVITLSSELIEGNESSGFSIN